MCFWLCVCLLLLFTFMTWNFSFFLFHELWGIVKSVCVEIYWFYSFLVLNLAATNFCSNEVEVFLFFSFILILHWKFNNTLTFLSFLKRLSLMQMDSKISKWAKIFWEQKREYCFMKYSIGKNISLIFHISVSFLK